MLWLSPDSSLDNKSIVSCTSWAITDPKSKHQTLEHSTADLIIVSLMKYLHFHALFQSILAIFVDLFVASVQNRSRLSQ